MKSPGFEHIIDCSDHRSCFYTLDNAEHPFSKIQERTQIQSRQIAHDAVDVAQLTRLALGEMYKTLESGQEIGGLVLSSSNPEHHIGGLESLVEHIADMYKIRHFDCLNYACSGFPAAVSRAIEMCEDLQGEEESRQRVAVITAEILSQIVDWQDENTSILFGDGVAAATIVPNGRHEILDAWARDNIDDPDMCLRMESKQDTVTVNGERSPFERDIVVMDGGKKLYKSVPGSLVTLSENSHVGLEGTDRIVPHQANGKFIAAMEKILGKKLRSKGMTKDIPIVGTIAHQANSASASIPRALAATMGDFSAGEVISCPAKGAGKNYEEGKLTEGLVLFRVG